jgi:hypothetical protein
MEKIIHNIMSSYYFAIVAIIFGIWKLRDTIKNTPRYTDSALQPFMSGIVAGIGSIILGVIIMYFKITGKL